MATQQKRKRLVRVLFGVAIVVVLGFSLLHLSAVEERVRELVESQAESRIDGSLRIGSLDYRLWRGEATLRDVDIELDDGLLRRVHVERVRVQYRPPGGLAVEAVEPLVILESVPEETSASEPSTTDGAPTAILPLWLEELEVIDGTVRYADPSAAVRARLAPIRLSLKTSDGASRTISLSAEGGTATWSSGDIDVESLRASGRLVEARLELDSVALDSSAGTVTVEGAITEFSPLTAELELGYDLVLDALFPAEGNLTGTAEVDVATAGFHVEGRTRIENLRREDLGPYAGEASFRFSDDTLSVSTDLRGDGLTLDARADLDFGNETEHVELTLQSPSLREVLGDVGAPEPPWDSAFQAEASLTTSRWNPETVDGEATVTFDDEAGDDLAGTVRVDAVEGTLTARTKDLSFPGGRLEATARLRELEEVTASYAVDIAALSPTLERWLPEASDWIEGGVELTGEVAGNLTGENLRASARLADSNLRIRGEPYTVSSDVVYEDGELRLDELVLRGEEGGELVADAVFDAASRELSVDGRLEQLALGPFARMAAVPASAEATGRFAVRGSLDRPRPDVTIELSSISYQDTSIPPLLLEVASAPESSRAPQADIGITLAESDARFLDGTVELAPPYLLAAEIELAPLPWTVIAELVPSIPQEATLHAAGQVEISMPLSAPSRLELEAEIERLSATIEGRELDTSSFHVYGTTKSIEISDLTLRHQGQELLSVEGTVPFDASAEGKLSLEADIALEVVEDWIPGARASGHARADLELSGSLATPELTGSVRIDDGSFVYRGVPVSGLNASAEATGDALRLESLRAEVLEGSVTANGNVPLPFAADAPEREAGIVFDITGINAASFREEGLGLDETIQTSISLGGAVRFPRGDFSRVRASGELQEIFLATEGAVVSLDAKASWTYGPEGFDTTPIHLVGDETDLRLAVEALRGEDDAPLLVAADGRLDLILANVVLPDAVFISGVADFEGVEARVDEGWALAGTTRLAGVELVVERPPLVVSDVGARLELDGKRIIVDELRGKPGGGTLTGSGELTLAPLSPVSPEDPNFQASFDLEIEDVRLEYPRGLRSQLSADLQLRTVDDRYNLGGDVTIEQAIYDRRFAIEDVLTGALRRETLDIAKEPGILDRVDLRISVESSRDIVVDNNLGRLQASSDVLVTGTAAAPELNGTLRAVPGGTLTFGANAYEIETARVALTTFPVLPPEIDIRATTEAGGHELILEVKGRLDNLQTTLESPTDPSLSRADVASLLLTGRTVEDVRGEEGEVLGQQAALYLGGRLASLTEEGLSEALPVSSVRLQPTLVGQETDPGVRFSLGQAITEDLFLTYSIGLNDAEKQLWIIDYELPHQLSVRVVRGDGNEYTGGLSQDLYFDFYDRARPKVVPEDEPKPKVLEVRLEGEIPLAPSEAREEIDLEAGDDYDYWDAREEAEELVERLRDVGYLNARVQLTSSPEHVENDVAPGEGAEPAPVVVIYEIEAGPIIELDWRGDDVGGEVVEWTREQFEGYLPPRAQAARLKRGLTYRLISRGYYDANVETTAVVDEAENRARIVIEVELGRRGDDVDVDFEGNATIDDETLLKVLPEPRTPEFFERVVGNPEELREELRLLYASRGFLNARVSSIATEFGPDQENLAVTIEIDEGEPFQVSSVELEGATNIEESRLRELLQLATGERFFLDTYLGDRRRLASFYRREGFPDVSVTGDLRLSDGGVAVRFQIKEGAQARVREIVVEGAKATDESVIKKAVTFEPGDPLRLTDLTETQSRLYDLQIFRSVNVSAIDRDDGKQEETVLIEVTELPDLRLGYGLRYTTDDQLEVTGDVHLPNLLGGGRQLTLTGLFSGSREIYRTNLASPYFFGIDVDTNVFVERELEDAETFNANSWTLTFQQRHPLREHLVMQWSASYNRGTVSEKTVTGPIAFDIHAARTTLNLSFISDTRNSLTRPTSGRFWTASAEYGPDYLGSDFNFVKFFGQLFFYRSLTPNLVWASSYRAGIANAFDQVLLPDTRFRAGGPNSVRGFPVNELGEPDPLLGVPIGGEGIVVLNQELRFPIFWRFGGVTFYDAGNVYLEAQDFDPTDLRHSLGAGLTVDLPVGLLTIDWARVLNPPEGLDSSRLHISFGYAF